MVRLNFRMVRLSFRMVRLSLRMVRLSLRTGGYAFVALINQNTTKEAPDAIVVSIKIGQFKLNLI